MSDAAVPEREGAATRVVLTYDAGEMPEAARFRVHDEVTDETFRASLRSRHDQVRTGDRFEEFVSRGCGVPVDVTLRAAAVEGGHRLDESADVVIERTD